MKFRQTIVQAVVSVAVLTLLFGLWGRGRTQSVVNTDEPTYTLPIVMYHSILKDAGRHGKYVLSPDMLARDLDILQSKGYQTVTVSDVVAFVQQGTPLPDKPVMLTFDDGYYNNYVYAYPLLRERNMKAVISVIGSQTALFTQNGEENAYWSHVTLDHLRQMRDVFEIQNHSWSLHQYGERRGVLRMRGESAEEYTSMLREDTAQTQKLLTEAGLPTPICYTYPFGARSDESAEIIHALGFVCTLGCEEKRNLITRDPACLYDMGRYNHAAGESSEQFLARVLGE